MIPMIWSVERNKGRKNSKAVATWKLKEKDGKENPQEDYGLR